MGELLQRALADYLRRKQEAQRTGTPARRTPWKPDLRQYDFSRPQYGPPTRQQAMGPQPAPFLRKPNYTPLPPPVPVNVLPTYGPQPQTPQPRPYMPMIGHTLDTQGAAPNERNIPPVMRAGGLPPPVEQGIMDAGKGWLANFKERNKYFENMIKTRQAEILNLPEDQKEFAPVPMSKYEIMTGPLGLAVHYARNLPGQLEQAERSGTTLGNLVKGLHAYVGAPVMPRLQQSDETITGSLMGTIEGVAAQDDDYRRELARQAMSGTPWGALNLAIPSVRQEYAGLALGASAAIAQKLDLDFVDDLLKVAAPLARPLPGASPAPAGLGQAFAESGSTYRTHFTDAERLMLEFAVGWWVDPLSLVGAGQKTVQASRIKRMAHLYFPQVADDIGGLGMWDRLGLKTGSILNDGKIPLIGWIARHTPATNIYETARDSVVYSDHLLQNLPPNATADEVIGAVTTWLDSAPAGRKATNVADTWRQIDIESLPAIQIAKAAADAGQPVPVNLPKLVSQLADSTFVRKAMDMNMLVKDAKTGKMVLKESFPEKLAMWMKDVESAFLLGTPRYVVRNMGGNTLPALWDGIVPFHDADAAKDMVLAFPQSHLGLFESTTGEAVRGADQYRQMLGGGTISQKIPIVNWWSRKILGVAQKGRVGSLPIGEQAFRLNLTASVLGKLDDEFWRVGRRGINMRPTVGPDVAGPWAGAINTYLANNLKLSTAELRAGVVAILNGGNRPALEAVLPNRHFFPTDEWNALSETWQKARTREEWLKVLTDAENSIKAQGVAAAAKNAHVPTQVGDSIPDVVDQAKTITVPDGPAESKALAEQVAQEQMGILDDAAAQMAAVIDEMPADATDRAVIAWDRLIQNLSNHWRGSYQRFNIILNRYSTTRAQILHSGQDSATIRSALEANFRRYMKNATAHWKKHQEGAQLYLDASLKQLEDVVSGARNVDEIDWKLNVEDVIDDVALLGDEDWIARTMANRAKLTQRRESALQAIKGYVAATGDKRPILWLPDAVREENRLTQIAIYHINEMREMEPQQWTQIADEVWDHLNGDQVNVWRALERQVQLAREAPLQPPRFNDTLRLIMFQDSVHKVSLLNEWANDIGIATHANDKPVIQHLANFLNKHFAKLGIEEIPPEVLRAAPPDVSRMWTQWVSDMSDQQMVAAIQALRKEDVTEPIQKWIISIQRKEARQYAQAYRHWLDTGMKGDTPVPDAAITAKAAEKIQKKLHDLTGIDPAMQRKAPPPAPPAAPAAVPEPKPKPLAPAPAAAPTVKRPWEMSFEEFAAYLGTNDKGKPINITSKTKNDVQWVRARHKEVIAEALGFGEDVPDAVLAQYWSPSAIADMRSAGRPVAAAPQPVEPPAAVVEAAPPPAPIPTVPEVVAPAPAPEVIPTAAPAAPAPISRGDIVEYQGKQYEVTKVGGMGALDIAQPGGEAVTVMPQQVTVVGKQQEMDLTGKIAPEIPPAPSLPAAAPVPNKLTQTAAMKTSDLEGLYPNMVFEMRQMAKTMIGELQRGTHGSKLFIQPTGAEGMQVSGIPSTNPYWYRKLFADKEVKSKPITSLKRIVGGTDTKGRLDTVMRRTIIERIAEGEDELLGQFPPSVDAQRIMGVPEEFIINRAQEINKATRDAEEAGWTLSIVEGETDFYELERSDGWGDNYFAGPLEEIKKFLRKITSPNMGITPPGWAETNMLLDRIMGKSTLNGPAATMDATEGMLWELDQIRKNSGKLFDTSVMPAPKQVKDKALAWMDTEAIQKHQLAKTIISRAATDTVDDVLLDYGLQRNFDRILGLLMPYHYWTTRSAWNWAGRAAHHPLFVATYLKTRQNRVEERQSDNGLRPRFWNSLKAEFPWLPDYFQDALYFNPDSLVMPFSDWSLVNWEDAGESNTWWQNAMLLAQGFGMNPHVPYQMVADKIEGRDLGGLKDYIPQYNMLANAWAPTPKTFGPGIGGGKYDTYRTNRMLASMAADEMMLPDVDYQNPQEVLEASRRAGKVDIDPVLPYLDAQARIEAWQRGELSPSEVNALFEDELIGEAFKRVGEERRWPVLSSFWTGLGLTPVAEGERTQVSTQAAERAAAYNPATGEGSREDVLTIRDANPFVRARWGQYGALPNEEVPVAERIYWDTFKDAGFQNVTETYDKLIGDTIIKSPANHEAFKALNKMMHNAFDQIEIQIPKEETDFRLWSTTGARPEEAEQIRADQIVYILNKTGPQYADFDNGDGTTNWDAYNLATEEWYKALPQIAASNADVMHVLEAQWPEKDRKAILNSLASREEMEEYDRRFHDPLEALHRTVWNAYYQPIRAYYDELDRRYGADFQQRKDAYYEEVKANWGDNILEIQDGYFKLPDGSQARRNYLKNHPQLKAYWDGNKPLRRKYRLVSYYNEREKLLAQYENDFAGGKATSFVNAVLAVYGDERDWTAKDLRTLYATVADIPPAPGIKKLNELEEIRLAKLFAANPMPEPQALAAGATPSTAVLGADLAQQVADGVITADDPAVQAAIAAAAEEESGGGGGGGSGRSRRFYRRRRSYYRRWRSYRRRYYSRRRYGGGGSVVIPRVRLPSYNVGEAANPQRRRVYLNR